MPTINDFHRWRTEHHVVLPNQPDVDAPIRDWFVALLLLPLASFIVVQTLVRLVG